VTAENHPTTQNYGTAGSYGTTSEDPDQIRREIERTQANLSTDVDALTEKVTPGRIVERRVERVRGTAGRWKDKVMGSNPLRSGGGAITGTHSSGGALGGGARDTADQMVGSVSDTTSSAASAVSDAASTAADVVADAPQTARRQTQGNPLAAGLIAFGAGWLISSLLPAGRREQELAGQAKDRASELGRPIVEAARQAATEVKDNLAEPAQEAVGSVRSTATEAGRTVAEEGRAAAGQVQGQAQDSAGNVRQNASPS
jgi:hypothetical protein